MSMLPFLRVHHIGQYEFAVRSLFEFSIVILNESQNLYFIYSALRGIQESLQAGAKALCDCLIQYIFFCRRVILPLLI